MLQPTKASISTPVLPVIVTTQSICKESFSWLNWILILQFSMARGWQKGIKSDVFLTAIVPAMIAVANTGPFADCISFPFSKFTKAGGRIIKQRACAVRLLGTLLLTSTIVGRLDSASIWESALGSEPWALLQYARLGW